MDKKNSITLSIADIPVRLNFMGERYEGIEEKFRNFMDNDRSEGSFMVNVQYSDQGYPSTEEISCAEDERGVLTIGSRDLVGNIDTRSGRAIMRLRRNRESLQTLLQVIYSILLVREGGFLFHSCGLLRDGSGYLFFGPSGSGKSTLAEISSDLVCLSDDKVAVRSNGSGFMIHSTPFSGTFDSNPENMSAGLRGCYSIKKGREHRLVELHPGDALSVLWESVLSIERSKKTWLNTLETLEKLMGTLPVRRLVFKQDAGFWGKVF